MYVYILIFYISRFCMLFDNNTRSEALLRIKTRIPVSYTHLKNDIMRLINNQDADMLLTDPPYNVDYVGKTAEALKIKNDNMSDNQFYEFLKKVFENMYSVTKEGASI